MLTYSPGRLPARIHMAGRCRFVVPMVSMALNGRMPIGPLSWHPNSVLGTGALVGKAISSTEKKT